MSPPLDTKTINRDLVGAIYFAVGRGTEGGNASYHLAIAGLTKGTPPNEKGTWGNQTLVAGDSGYSIGAIQVDLGKRGTWPLGATENRKLRPGECSYVDSIIEQAASYARKEGLPFSRDIKQLRTQLLSHGHGPGGLQFMDADTKESIDRWASSNEGKIWIHNHIDMPQILSLTRMGVETINRNGQNIKEEDRFSALCILVKAGNQLPGLVPGFNSSRRGHITGLEETLVAGGDYQALKLRVAAQKRIYPYYAADKAAVLGGHYEAHLEDPALQPVIKRADWKVTEPDYNPSLEAKDADIQRALDAFKHPISRHKKQANLSPQLLHDFDFIRGSLQSDGRWNPTEVDNISAALLQAAAENDAIKRIDRVIIGDPAPLDGQVRAFAQYRPHGEPGPAISAHVVASQAAARPASHNLSQLPEAIDPSALRQSPSFHQPTQSSDSPRLQA